MTNDMTQQKNLPTARLKAWATGADKDGRDAPIPAGEVVEIHGETATHYLIESRAGLMGWVEKPLLEFERPETDGLTIGDALVMAGVLVMVAVTGIVMLARGCEG